MNFLCPFHNDINASFSVKNGIGYCYGCKNISNNKLVFKIKKFEIFFDKNLIEYANYSLYYKKNFWLKYLLIRNINALTIFNFNLGSVDFLFKKNLNNILVNRLIFPIINESNILEGIGLKTLNNKNKYLLFSKNNIELNFYGLNKVKNYNYIVIVEGYFDLLTLQKNFINSLSLLGSNITCYKINFLIKKFKKIYFCFDGDYAGNEACEKIKKNIFNKKILYKTLPYNYDPDNYIKKFGIKSFLNFLKI